MVTKPWYVKKKPISFVKKNRFQTERKLFFSPAGKTGVFVRSLFTAEEATAPTEARRPNG
jgi:hypothetical protein